MFGHDKSRLMSSDYIQYCPYCIQYCLLFWMIMVWAASMKTIGSAEVLSLNPGWIWICSSNAREGNCLWQPKISHGPVSSCITCILQNELALWLRPVSYWVGCEQLYQHIIGLQTNKQEKVQVMWGLRQHTYWVLLLLIYMGPWAIHFTGYCCWFDVGPWATHFTGYCCWYIWGLGQHTLLGIVHSSVRLCIRSTAEKTAGTISYRYINSATFPNYGKIMASKTI
jgi:hypothetical protein